MTEITDEGRKLAAELANAAIRDFGLQSAKYDPLDLGRSQNAAYLALARLATDHLALQKSLEAAAWGEREAEQALAALKARNAETEAKHEKAVADLREIDRLMPYDPVYPGIKQAAAIAAKYRETDELVGVAEEAMAGTREETAQRLRAELSKRGFELARVKP